MIATLRRSHRDSRGKGREQLQRCFLGAVVDSVCVFQSRRKGSIVQRICCNYHGLSSGCNGSDQHTALCHYKVESLTSIGCNTDPEPTTRSVDMFFQPIAGLVDQRPHGDRLCGPHRTVDVTEQLPCAVSCRTAVVGPCFRTCDQISTNSGEGHIQP